MIALNCRIPLSYCCTQHQHCCCTAVTIVWMLHVSGTAVTPLAVKNTAVTIPKPTDIYSRSADSRDSTGTQARNFHRLALYLRTTQQFNVKRYKVHRRYQPSLEMYSLLEIDPGMMLMMTTTTYYRLPKNILSIIHAVQQYHVIYGVYYESVMKISYIRRYSSCLCTKHEAAAVDYSI